MSPAKKAAGAAKKALPSVVALVGDEERKKERLLAELVERAGADASVLSWQKDPTEKAEGELSRLLTDHASRPLFGGAKLIVVRDGDGLVKRSGKSLAAALKVDAGNRIVLMCRALDQRTGFAKALKKAGGLIVCARPKVQTDASGAVPPGSELVQEIVADARRQGLKIDPRAAVELAGRTGNDLMLAANELEKISVYRAAAAGAPVDVTLADVEELVPQSAAWDQFQLFQEVATGRLDRALRRVRGMLDRGTVDRSGRRTTDPRSIALLLVALIHQRLKTLARFGALKSRGASKDEMLSALRIRNPGQLYYLEREASLPLIAQADACIAPIIEADRALKLSRPAGIVIERMVVQLARLAQAGRGGGRAAR